MVIRHLQFFQLLKRFQLSEIGYQILPEEELLQTDTCQGEREGLARTQEDKLQYYPPELSRETS